MDNEQIELIDQIIKNAHYLGKISARAEKIKDKPWLINIEDEWMLQRYYQILREQESLIEELRNAKKVI